ncbi:hypothetical protein DPMN_049092 [Dreissena polymorpha]|uniref:Allorecognition 2 n=1 Tax=Dreissena polymorpha TaxID=45954 RepID=A0A9D4DAR3_DREPO|nr:hypothetical protein DPMN_049092 [Dreissena polymorpha]
MQLLGGILTGLLIVQIVTGTNRTLTVVEMKETAIESSTKNKYNVSYTGHGGILRILNIDEETTGTYRCYETFDPRNFVTTIIKPSPIAIEADNPIKTPAPSDIINPIVMFTLNDKSFECASHADITFKIINNTSNTINTTANELDERRVNNSKNVLTKVLPTIIGLLFVVILVICIRRQSRDERNSKSY